MGSDWFATRQLDDDVFLIAEPPHVNSFLVVGDERAALIDSGMGIGSIRPVAESLTDRPIEVVNTHYHWDHSGGDQEFERAAIHELGAEELKKGESAEDLAFYRTDVRAGGRADTHICSRSTRGSSHSCPMRRRRGRCRTGFDLTDLVAPPRGRPPASSATATLVDLGGRALTVLHTPGHTPDSSCLLDERAPPLLGGDTVNTGPMYAHQVDSNVDDFAASTARLAHPGDERALGLRGALRPVQDGRPLPGRAGERVRRHRRGPCRHPGGRRRLRQAGQARRVPDRVGGAAGRSAAEREPLQVHVPAREHHEHGARSAGTRPARTAANAVAPPGSTTCFARSHSIRMAAMISSSVTVSAPASPVRRTRT